MKLINILVIFLTFSQISLNICGALSRNHRYKRTRRNTLNTQQAAKNKWYQFAIGVILGAAGTSQPNDIDKINQCIPKDWQAVDAAPIANEPAKASAAEKSTFDKILGIVQKAVDMVCKFKDKILGLIGARVRKALRRYRYRILVETGVTTYNRNHRKGFIKKLSGKINAVAGKAKNAAKSVAGKIKDGAKAVGGKVVEVAKEVGGFVAAVAQNFVKSIKGFINRVVTTIKTFFSGDVVGKIQKIVECGKTLAGVATGIVGIIKGIISTVALISSIAGHNYLAIAQLILKLICNYKLFALAYDHLKNAINNNDTLLRFGYVGKFLGTLLRALVTKRKI